MKTDDARQKEHKMDFEWLGSGYRLLCGKNGEDETFGMAFVFGMSFTGIALLFSPFGHLINSVGGALAAFGGSVVGGFVIAGAVDALVNKVKTMFGPKDGDDHGQTPARKPGLQIQMKPKVGGMGSIQPLFTQAYNGFPRSPANYEPGQGLSMKP